jgi:glycosyltransferase involved in cell wall biosynthesis
LGVRRDQVFLLDNGVEVESFQRTSSAQSSRRRWFPFVGDGILLGAMGRLSSEKGFDRLIRIVAEQISAGKNWFLVIAGDGDERNRLQTLIEELGMVGRIRLLGFCEQIRDFYESLDLFVLSSFREGLPNVVLEAMAYEVPVLSTRVAGVPRLIEHAEHGWLVGIDDRQALADGLVKLAEDASLRQRLASAARKRVKQSFNFRERARKQCQLYQQLLSR